MNALASLRGSNVRMADLSDGGDRQRIDAFITASPEAQIFHRPQWSIAVAHSCGHRSHYLVAEGTDGALTGLLPLSEIRSKLFGSALVSSGFGVGGGIVASDTAAAELLGETASTLALQRSIPSVELRGGAVPGGFAVQEGLYCGFERALPHDEDAMLKSVPRKQRAEVRKALGAGFTISVGTGPAERESHYRVYSESVRNLGTPVFPRALFDAMLDEFGDCADILTVRQNGRPVASVLSFYFKGTVLPYWGGGTREARASRANEMLYFALMRHAAERGCDRFDFGRSKQGTGAFAYKKNWGFDPVPLRYGVWTAGGAPPRVVNPLDPKYRLQIALWRRLPLPLANFIGPIVARGLG